MLCEFVLGVEFVVDVVGWVDCDMVGCDGI